MERRKFEDSFQEAFKDAEVSPSDNVWTNIELDLERAEGGKMKRRLFFFKTLAAASIAFAVFMTGIGYYLLKDQAQSNNLAQVPVEKESNDVIANEESAVDNIKNGKTQRENLILQEDSNFETTEQSLANQTGKSAAGDKTGGALQEGESANSKNSISDQDLVKQELKLSTKDKIAETNNVGKNEFYIGDQEVEAITKSKDLTHDASKNGDVSIQNSVNSEGFELDNKSVADNDDTRTTTVESFEKNSITDKNSTSLIDPIIQTNSEKESSKLPSFYQPKNPELQLPVTKADPGALLLAKLADEERAYNIEDKKKQKDQSEKLWTSVGFAAGGFNSPNPSVSPPAYSSLSSTSTVAAQQSKASGLAYSVGVGIGANLSDRWVLQGGVNYLTQSSDYTANNVIVPDNNQMGIQAESINAYNNSKLADGSSQSRVAPTFPYNVNNNVQFVSVPVQAGYMVVNKKFGFQV
ncbi:MAG TPA: hypothetical protein VJ184_15355, partial [Chryseolinea sp.]|nr:hypothetical protein [Chryseolinea sp.]